MGENPSAKEIRQQRKNDIIVAATLPRAVLELFATAPCSSRNELEWLVRQRWRKEREK